MGKKLFLISTGVGVVPVVQGLVGEMAPDVEVFNIVDDSVVPAIRVAGNVLTPDIARRVANHIISAEQAGADLILVTCSSINEVPDFVQPLVSVPILKIDEPMAREAVRGRTRIGVLATLQTTLRPTTQLIRRVAAEQGQRIELKEVLCEGAFEALTFRGDAGTHDRIVQTEISKVADQVEVIVLAQASMARAVEGLNMHVPVLTSPRLGVQAAVKRLREL